jgi:isochorismate pyruvate lyase
MKRPDDCNSIEDVRDAIDQTDREIIALLAQRGRYVHRAAAFKKTEDGVRAPGRVEAMLAQRRAWAAEHRLNPEFVEQLYRQVVDHFIRQELSAWKGSPD